MAKTNTKTNKGCVDLGKVVRIEPTNSYVEPKIHCQTCENFMSVMRGQFPICDDCLKDLREIIAERRKPKVVEIGPRIPGGENV